MRINKTASVIVNKTSVNVLGVDTSKYPDLDIQELINYNHISDPSAQGTTLKVGFGGKMGLLSNGLPEIPVILFGNKYPTVGSAVLYKLTVLTNETEFIATVDKGILSVTADGIVVQMPETTGDVILKINDYTYRIVVQDSGSVNPFKASQIVTLNSISPIFADGYIGGSIVISNDGNWLAAGLQVADVNTGQTLPYVAVFSKTMNGQAYNWTLNSLLSPSSPDTGSTFAAWALDINADGSVIVAGAIDSKITENFYSVSEPALNAGDITVFKRSGVTWDSGHRFYLPELTPSTNLSFGYSVAISDAGNRIVVGQPNLLDQSTTTDVEASSWVIDFNLSTNEFTIIKSLQNVPGNKTGSKYGMGVAISGDGNHVFSTNYYFTAGNVVSRLEEFIWDGSAFPSDPTSWFNNDISQLLIQTNAADYGSKSIRLSSDANTIVIAVPFADINGTEKAGKIQVLKRETIVKNEITSYQWLNSYEILSPRGLTSYELFGSGIDISADAQFIFSGSWETFSGIPSEGGSVYVFQYNPSTDTYELLQQILSENYISGGFFGCAIAFDSVSKYLAVGQEVDSPASVTGSIHYVPVGTLLV